MSDPFVAEIRVFGFNYAPNGWAQCNGQNIPISQNTALYSLLGTTYGGDGRTSFNLPNLQGNVACSSGQGANLTNRPLGSAFGTPAVTLNVTQLAAHSHALNARVATSGELVNTPTNGCHLARTYNQFDYTNTENIDTRLAPQMIGQTGGGQAHANQQPYLALNFCIALQGIYPSRS